MIGSGQYSRGEWEAAQMRKAEEHGEDYDDDEFSDEVSSYFSRTGTSIKGEKADYTSNGNGNDAYAAGY